ncbi:hypothetical protein DB35_05785 [Streptomyces abyssalis]|uniref:DUF4267 domain-containing protein n=1 Tax=Streptomyces abyssalis TaxID=933944 RepID=A0A1E7JTG0_9ACTN|nr:hypothetical protein [Streptomyces abyssalis]OEU92141.1 hypothetical protein AN215_06960 [Streptomyces abyssalis]OEU94578.1 hypothetical protein DB35_05785 [Streptomyces abyssalis]OEV30415.1 hypothetical protein AN219_11030 [Streptomyces nanshensis]
MHVKMLRMLGAATALYGLAVTARPELLARPSGLADPEGRVAEETRISLRPLVWRDVAGGLAMLCAPEGPALRTAAVVRIASDFGDAALLGSTLPRSTRAKAVAVSVGWGALSVAALCAPGRTGQRRGSRPGRCAGAAR